MTSDQLRFGSSEQTHRTEDVPLLTGRGRFTDDGALPGQAHAAFVRAPVAHAEIRRVECAAAKGMPGVRAVFTAQDLAAEGIGDIPPLVSMSGRDGKPMGYVTLSRKLHSFPLKDANASMDYIINT